MRTRLGMVVVALAALALPLAGERPTWAQRGPIKVALLVPTTGPLSANGRDMINGLELYFEEQKYRLAGREIKLIVEDDEGKPATGLTKARGLVEGQGVHVILGPLSAAVGYAIAPYLDGKKVPTIFPIVSSEDITQRKRSPYIVRTGWTSAQPMHPFGKWVYDNLKYRKIAMIGYDFAFGWEVAAGFHRTFEEAGGQVVQKLWPPLNTPDFAPYVAQLRRDVDAVWCVFSGADALRFSKQYAEAGLRERLPLIGNGTFTDELLGGHVRGGRRAEGGARGHRGRHRDRRQVPRSASPRRSLRRAPRCRQVRRLRQPDPEHLRAQGREGGWPPPEHGDPYLPERLPVLDVQARGVPEKSRVLARLPTVHALLTAVRAERRPRRPGDARREASL
ncbi:MAG: hypothetical protein DME12_19800 [Candidatus Rokuibacteriota bacterium]|nr:MAG: hypothetical protein DME12_19800 [Candidatus Rokubacteria bacterium]